MRSRLIAARIVLIWTVSAFSSRVRMGTTPTVACPWARGRLQDGWTSPVGVNVFLSSETFCRSGQSVALVTPGSCVVKTIFVKGVDGDTVVHRVRERTVVGDLLDCTEDVWVTYNGKMVEPGDTMSHIGIGDHDTSRCGGRLRGGAQRSRPPPIDIPGQWTCQGCGHKRVWPGKTRCFRCGCPKGHVPPQPDSFLAGPLGRLLQRTAPPMNPTYRPSVRILSLFPRMA